MHVLRSLILPAILGLIFALSAAEPVRAEHREFGRSIQPVPAVYVGARKISTPAFVDQRQLFVPLRGVFEAIGASVEFTAQRFVVIRKDGVVIAAFILDRTHAIVGNRAVDLDAAPTRRGGRVYVPLRVVAEAAGATVAYTSRPSAVHIRQVGAVASAAGVPTLFEPPATGRWRMGVAVFTGACALGCLVLTARRFAPTLFRPAPVRAAQVPPSEPPQLSEAPADRVALTSIEAAGEARFHKEVVQETRTIAVPVRREELVIEYSGDGGTVLIEGRELLAGQTVRIPLWEERVHVDVTKHVLLEQDVVVDKRRTPRWTGPPESGQPLDFTVAEGSPS